jgi:hypothetical protein
MDPIQTPESGDALPLAPAPRELRGFPLGTVMLRLGLLAEETINEALSACARTHMPLGRYLVGQGLVDDADLARALAFQKGLPFLEADGVVPDPAAAGLLTGHSARTIGALPFGFDNGVPVVAIGDPTNERALEQIREALPDGVLFAVAAPDRIADAIAAVYGLPEPARLVSLPAPRPEPAPEPAGIHRVVLCLVTGERLEFAAVDAREPAERRRKGLIAQLKRGDWPVVGERAIRPEAVVSIDLVESRLDA